jgi:hypothetical protein
MHVPVKQFLAISLKEWIGNGEDLNSVPITECVLSSFGSILIEFVLGIDESMHNNKK